MSDTKEWIYKIDTLYYQYQNPKKKFEFKDIIIPRQTLSIITGETGLGKTTLLNILGLEDYLRIEGENNDILFRPDIQKETIKYSSIYRSKKKIQKIRKNFGFMFQQDYLIDAMTCWENIFIPYFLRKKDSNEYKKANDLIKEFGFKDLLENEKNEKNEITPPMNRSPSTLSGGQRQRVALIRAMIHSPLIVFADEPLASVNEKIAIDIMNSFIKQVKRGMTIIMIGHDTYNHIYKSIDTNDYNRYVNIIKLENHVTKFYKT